MHTRMMTVQTGKRQQGVVLLVGLIMLLLMTVVGLAAIRGSNLQETMAGNMRERQVAFQVAEAGLRQGENFIQQQNLEAMAFNGTVVPWQLPDMNQQPNQDSLGLPQVRAWDKNDWTANANDAAVDLGDMNAGGPPQYLVERLEIPAQAQAGAEGSGIGVGSLEQMQAPEVYRLTSRGMSASTNSDAVVQIAYRKN